MSEEHEPRRRGRPPAPGTPEQKAARRKLRALRLKLDAIEAKHAMLRTTRDTMIFQLVQRESLSLEEIGQLSGLSRQRVWQIARRRRRELEER